jgi:hypothetical protein
MIDEEMNTLAACGLEELFSSCAVVAVFVLVGNRSWFNILTYVTKQIILQNNIFLIVVEVLRFQVRQCVVSFCSHFQYSLLPLLTPHSSDPRSKHQRYSSCKQQHCYCLCFVDLSSLLLAAITIVVK